MKIRPAEQRDLDAIAAIERAAIRDGWSRAQIAEELDRELARVLVAEQDGVMLGFAIGWSVAGESEVMELAVHPEARRQGVGAALLRALIAAFGEGPTFLEVRTSNVPAIALYEREGFQRVGQRRAYYANGEDALLMCRPAQPEERSL